jgi:hypothetical protein
VRSADSRRLYRHTLVEFFSWYAAASHSGFSKAVVQEYRAGLERRGLSGRTINVKLGVVRKLAAEAAGNGLLAPELAAGVQRSVKSVRCTGVRTGHWLTQQKAE